MKTSFFTLLCLVCSILSAGEPMGEPILEKGDVFPAGMSGISVYRIPGMVITAKGTVLAYCEARRDNAKDWGEIQVQLRRSLDNGRSWEPAKHIAHLGDRIEGNPHNKTDGDREQTVNNPVAIIDRSTGSIEFLYCVNYARCFSMRSMDDGVTWSKPVEITKSFDPFRSKYDWKVIATGPGHGIQLKSGRLVVPVWLAYGKIGDHAPSAAATIYSDDHGQTWQAGDLAVPNEGEFGNPNETTIAELSDGRVMLVSRNVSNPNRKLITIGPDGARQWGRPTFHDALWEPICMASIISHPSKSGTLIFSCPHTLNRDGSGNELPARSAKRENLSVQLSYDDGLSWPIRKTLEASKSAYSDLAVLPDGSILCLYEGDRKIVCARFNLEWILD